MGRGRAKAKQTKVARDLKYRTHETDFGALAKEMHGGPGSSLPAPPVEDVVEDDSDDDTEDEWADYRRSVDRD